MDISQCYTGTRSPGLGACPTRSPWPRNLGALGEMFLLVPNLVKLEKPRGGACQPVLKRITVKWRASRQRDRVQKKNESGNMLCVFLLEVFSSNGKFLK